MVSSGTTLWLQLSLRPSDRVQLNVKFRNFEKNTYIRAVRPMAPASAGRFGDKTLLPVRMIQCEITGLTHLFSQSLTAWVVAESRVALRALMSDFDPTSFTARPHAKCRGFSHFGGVLICRCRRS